MPVFEAISWVLGAFALAAAVGAVALLLLGVTWLFLNSGGSGGKTRRQR